jgi:hypothetical protein
VVSTEYRLLVILAIALIYIIENEIKRHFLLYKQNSRAIASIICRTCILDVYLGIFFVPVILFPATG